MDFKTVALDTNFILSFCLMLIIILRLLTLGKGKKDGDEVTKKMDSIIEMLVSKKDQNENDDSEDEPEKPKKKRPSKL